LEVIQAVTPIRIGRAPSTNEAALNVAIAEKNGLHVYPQAVTLTPGMQRRTLVGLDEQFTPNFKGASHFLFSDRELIH
jgi:hypothetical protein